MQLVYKFDINYYDRLCAICRVTNNLYNQALYIIRNELKDNDRWLFYPDLDRIMKNVTNLEGTVNYRLVKSHVAQQTLRVLDKAMKGYVKAHNIIEVIVISVYGLKLKSVKDVDFSDPNADTIIAYMKSLHKQLKEYIQRALMNK